MPEARPFIKWAGGKWTLAPRIAKLLPADLASRTYREPFLGGGALFFYLRARGALGRVVLSDTLADLVATYTTVRDRPKLLVDRLLKLQKAHSAEQFYEVRDRFNAERDAASLSRASWLIYLNRTCYNGLFRTNRSGLFNVPIGRFDQPRVVDPPRVFAAARALEGAQVVCCPFEKLRKSAQPGDVVYLDPPYVPLSKTASFASYATGAFGPADQARLADLYRELDRRGCKLVLSNSDTPEVHRLYSGFDLTPVLAARSISAVGTTRRPVSELVVRNFV